MERAKFLKLAITSETIANMRNQRVNVFQPHVQRTPDGWVMLYASATNVDQTPVHKRHSLAVSNDGLNWLLTQ